MKIIKQGKLKGPVEELYRATCPKCDTEFEYTDNDISFGPTLGTNVIICPLSECKQELIHSHMSNVKYNWKDRFKFIVSDMKKKNLIK